MYSSRPFTLARLSLLILICSHVATAQYRLESWTNDNGLPQNTVRSITQTRDGYLWLTTFDGLVRFDGVQFKVFNTNNTSESFFSPALSGHLLTNREQTSQLDHLSASERRVLLLVAESMSNKQIAEKMFISVRTVEHHRSNICSKLGLTGKNSLLSFALTHKGKL